MRRMRVARDFGVERTGFGVEPIGWPWRSLLVVHVFLDAGRRYRIRRQAPVSAFGALLYVERRDGAKTLVYDAVTGRLLRRIAPTFVEPWFTWPIADRFTRRGRRE